MSNLTKAFDEVFKDLRTDPYASEAETAALIKHDTRSPEEKRLHTMMDERGAWEQGVDSISVLRDIALELLTEQRRTPAPVAIDGNTSDGHHTFNELYEFRKVYNAALFNEWAAVGKCSVHKSWRHHDGELCFGGGWFIVVAVLPAGQISNHYEAKDWDLFAIPEAERALFEFDGHTGSDVVARLKSHTAQPTMAEVCCGKYDTCAKACTPKVRALEHREAAAQALECEIDSADFEDNTITLKVKSQNWKVSAGTYWLGITPLTVQDNQNHGDI